MNKIFIGNTKKKNVRILDKIFFPKFNNNIIYYIDEVFSIKICKKKTNHNLNKNKINLNLKKFKENNIIHVDNVTLLK